jgi:RNA polymerase sigma-70 factor (sigma-E family)
MRPQDEAEFAELVAAVSNRLVRTGYAICGDQQLAEDAVQSAFVTAYRQWRRVRAARNPEAYLRKMVVNQLLGWKRRKWFTSTTALGAGAEPAQASHEARVIEHQHVWTVVSSLPPRQRAVIVLRYYEGLSEAEIADVLGIRPGTVKSQSAAAIATLRGTLGEAEPVLPGASEGEGVA